MFVAKLFSEQILEESSLALATLSNDRKASLTRHNAIALELCVILDLPKYKFRRHKEREQFYNRLSEMLLDYPRLAMFLPFYILEKATPKFKQDYLKVWRACCAMSDTREEFHIGDYYEPEVSIGEPEHVVKATHLLPWLLKYEYIDNKNLTELAHEYRAVSNIAIWGLLEGAQAAHQMEIIDAETLRGIEYIAKKAKVKRPTPPQLLKTTAKRKKWLEDRAENYGINPNTFKLRNPAGPYSNNIKVKDIDIELPTSKHEHLILQGSRLKGYSRPRSDYDYFIYDDRNHRLFIYDKRTGKQELDYLTGKLERMSHIILLGAWIGEDEPSTLAAQKGAAAYYYGMDAEQEIMSLFSIERTTIQCRLLQKGFPCAHPNGSETTRNISCIDGDSAFYDDRFRKIASKICLKYCFLGQRIDLSTWQKALAYTTPPMVG